LLQYLVDGGVVMIPIGLCSLIAVAAFFERLWALRRSRVVPSALVHQLTTLLESGRFDEALSLCRKHEVSIARVLEVALQVRQLPRREIKERVMEVGRREAAAMERFIPVVGTIASITPLLGLLGTVGGMIQTFAAIQQSGLGNVDSLAGGISVALITTFAGLSVGIPAVVANRFLLSRVDALLMELEDATLAMLDILTEPDAESDE
jgi:biopolymer transport protein ExbB